MWYTGDYIESEKKWDVCAIALMEPRYGDHILHPHLYREIPKEHERPDIESQQAFPNISSEIYHNL